jgi:hypothetical protein
MYLKIWCEKKTFGKVGITCRTSLDLNSVHTLHWKSGTAGAGETRVQIEPDPWKYCFML